MKNTIALLLFIFSSVDAQQDSSFLFISDTQQPLWIETLRLKEHENEKATKIIYTALERESTAVAIFHLGDITSIGMFNSYWSAFDKFHNTIHVPIYPALGNHDYFFLQSYALEQFRNRFPAFTSTWYSVVVKAIAFMIVNSNISELSEDEHRQQQFWYQQQLSLFETDSTINSIVVLCHHSPYTNSTIVSPSTDAEQEFLIPFYQHHKTSVFISGHAHAYEHFQNKGKDFLVIGGGGGLLHPLLVGSEQRFTDVFREQSSLRFFHYMECRVKKNALQFFVKKLRNDFSGFDVVDTISVAYVR